MHTGELSFMLYVCTCMFVYTFIPREKSLDTKSLPKEPFGVDVKLKFICISSYAI